MLTFVKLSSLWYCSSMSERAANELFFENRAEVETALAALAHTGVNPNAQQRLQAILDFHDRMSAIDDDDTHRSLRVHAHGEDIVQEKTDIAASLDSLSTAESVLTETRIAAIALREIL